MLAPDVATRLRHGLGVDPGPVRVHTDALSGSATAELGVRAFTWGVDVFLAKGERPTDVPLLAHEVTHAIQQSGGPAIHLFDGPHGELEHEAHHNAAVVASGGQTAVHGRTSGPRVQGLELPGWAKRGVAAVGGVISEGATAIADVGAAVRDRVMTFIKDKAKAIRGYDLLCFVLGRDPITQQPVERTAESLIKGVLDLVPGGDALFANLQQAKVIQRAHDWFTAEIAKLNITWDYISGLLTQAWAAVDLTNPSGTWEKIKDIFGPPLSRLYTFAVDAGHKVLEFVFEGALALAGGAGQQILAIFRRIGSVFSLIVADPIKFLTNLLNAVKGGFNQFWANIGAHLRTGVFEWLMGAMQGVIKLPSKWDFSGILSLILQILGLTYSALRGILVKILGEKTVAYIEDIFQFVKLIATKGLSAAWEKIKEFAGGLADLVITAIRDWIAKSVVGAAVTKLVAMFNPIGVVIDAIITIYRTITFFIERAQQLARLVNSILDSVENIAKGATKTASDFVEKTLANTLPVILGFLASWLGLGSVTQYIRDIIGKIRATIAGALEKLGLWIKDHIQGLLRGRQGNTEPAGAPPNAETAATQLLIPQLQGRTREETKEIIARATPELRSKGVKSLELGPFDEDGHYDVLIESSPLRRFIEMVPAAMEHTAMRSVAQVVVRGEPLTTSQLTKVAPAAVRVDPKTGVRTELDERFRKIDPDSGEVPGAAVITPDASNKIQVVSWATNDYSTFAATSHAERYFVEWIDAQPWKNRIASIGIVNFNLNPCSICGGRLTELLQRLNKIQVSGNPIRARLEWSRPWPYEPYSVIVETLGMLTGAGWKVAPPSLNRNAYEIELKLWESRQKAKPRRS